jgi:putative holliday junction resolvase
VRVLALDIGEKRIGVAVSDSSGTVATPVSVVDAKSVLGDGRGILRLVKEYDIDLVVVGLPLSMDGSIGQQAQRVRAAGERLERFVPVPFVYYDERLSSVEAGRAMSAMGVSDRHKRGSIDMVAAALFLQSYLDARRTSESESET